MSFIYPECPSCDQKSEGGVPLDEMPVFDYDCPHCGFRSAGRFVQEPYPHVEWISERDEAENSGDMGYLSRLLGL